MVHILSIAVFTKNVVYIYIQKQDLKNSKKKKKKIKKNHNNNFLLTQLLTKKQNFSFFFSSKGEEKGHKSFTFKVIPPVRMSLWILYQKQTGRNRVGKSLPIMFSIVRTAGASPAELTNGKSYIWFFTKFIASGASPDASCPSLLALISAAGANPDARLN